MGTEWFETKFSELCDITRGSSPRPIHDWIAKEGIPWVKISDASSAGSRFIEHTGERIRSEGRSKSVSVYPGDLILSNSATPGIPMFMNIEACIHDGWLLLRNFRGLDKTFAYYLLLHDRPALVQQGNGSVFTNLKTDILKNHIVRLPPLPEQRAIAAVLGSLDDKIELNRRMNATLEGMARALFRSWFVDFDPVRAKMDGRDTGLPGEIEALFPGEMEDGEDGVERPRGWRIGFLNDFTEFVIGGDWGKDAAVGDADKQAYCIRGADIPSLQTGGLGKMPIRFLKAASLAKRNLQEGDLVIEISGGSPTQSTGRPVLVTSKLLDRLDKPLTYSNFCRLVRLSNKSAAKYIYLWLRWLYHRDDFLQFENGTTGIKNFAFTLFSEQYDLIIPPESVLKAFDNIVTPLFDRLQENGRHMDTLAALRDALLPKLMSGEIRISGRTEK